jgi:hypothetical protein
MIRAIRGQKNLRAKQLAALRKLKTVLVGGEKVSGAGRRELQALLPFGWVLPAK